jgi:hypothetical protein
LRAPQQKQRSFKQFAHATTACPWEEVTLVWRYKEWRYSLYTKLLGKYVF